MRSFYSSTALFLTLAVFVIHAMAQDVFSEQESRLWEQAVTQQIEFEQRHTVLDHPELMSHLGAVLSQLWSQVETELPPMTLKVVQDPGPGAFTYPHGVCYITTGMLVQLRNEDQLAMVIAHEMIHYVYRHTLGAVSYLQKYTGGPEATSATLMARRPENLTAYDLEAEKQADREGLRLLKKAGYAADRIIALLEDFQCGGRHHRQRDHLARGDHLSADRRLMIQSLAGRGSRPAEHENACRYDWNYLAKVSAALRANARLCIEMGLWDQAAQDLSAYQRLFPDDPRAYFLEGELYRLQSSGGGVPEAMRAYQQAIRLDRSFAPAYRELGVAHFKLGEKKRAGALFETYLALTPQGEGSEYIRGYLKSCGK